MTLVVGVDYGTEILVLADTRVSVSDRPDAPTPKDQLIKLVSVDFAQRSAILGFSGKIRVIKEIIESLQTRARYPGVFKRSGSLRDDFKGWMEDIVKRIRRNQKLEKLQFMLCDFNPSDEEHIYLYEIKENGEVLLDPPKTVSIIGKGGHPGRGKVAVIGSGSEFKQKIYEATLRPFGNPNSYNDYEAYSRFRTLMSEANIHSWFQDIPSTTVGGPFAIFRVRPNGLVGPNFAWPIGEDSPDTRVEQDGQKTVLYNPSIGKKYILFSISSYSDADFFGYEDACAK